jgi:AcrR family transcriptional regulator
VSEQVLGATVELIAQHGVAAVSYDAVAKLAGTSRATIYRKWPQRDDLIRAAFTRFAETSVAVPDTGDIRSDLVELLCMAGDMLATPVGRAIINASLMAGDNDPIRRLGQDVLQTRLAVLQIRIDSAVACGELPPWRMRTSWIPTSSPAPPPATASPSLCRRSWGRSGPPITSLAENRSQQGPRSSWA